MKKLLDVSYRHNIQRELFHSNVINKIYQLLGDSRVTRFPASKCDKELIDVENWNELVKFLEKELCLELRTT